MELLSIVFGKVTRIIFSQKEKVVLSMKSVGLQESTLISDDVFELFLLPIVQFVSNLYLPLPFSKVGLSYLVDTNSTLSVLVNGKATTNLVLFVDNVSDRINSIFKI